MITEQTFLLPQHWPIAYNSSMRVLAFDSSTKWQINTIAIMNASRKYTVTNIDQRHSIPLLDREIEGAKNVAPTATIWADDSQHWLIQGVGSTTSSFYFYQRRWACGDENHSFRDSRQETLLFIALRARGLTRPPFYISLSRRVMYIFHQFFIFERTFLRVFISCGFLRFHT